MKEILIATGNKGKIAEIRQFLAGEGLVVKSLSDFPEIIEVEESGNTFAENAILKARGYAIQSGLLALADDSGLEIDALKGAPGVFSARYGGDVGYGETRWHLFLSGLGVRRVPRHGRGQSR